MLHAAEDRLSAAGYDRYEISNYARFPEYRCKQNLAYWQRQEYLGLGLGAASLIDETRFSDTRDLTAYLTACDPAEIRENIESLSVSAQMEEFMFLGLRLTEGIHEAQFTNTFHRDIDSVYHEVIQKLISEELLNRFDGRIFLTPRGTDLANYVMAQFLLS